MGVNLVTKVRNFYVQTRTFTSSDHDVQDGCVTPGTHRLLRFDFLSHNAGDADLVVGSPAARPDLFVWSVGHGHYHLKDFNQFLLFDQGGTLVTTGYKQAFCAIDIERISPTASLSPRFNDCNSNQGISAGWADVYSSGLACQFIVIDGVPDGDYTLQSTTNAQHKVGEDCFGDNTIWTGLRLSGNGVTEIAPPYVPEDRIGFNRANVAAVQVGGRWKVAEGQHWMLDTGTSAAEAQRCVEIINHYRLASMCFVGRPRCGDVEPMMYWLTDSGTAPSGSLAGEDCIPFDRSSLSVVQVGDRWKVVEGTHWLMDFGPGYGNAVAALHFIRAHRFDQMCFVGRPGPSMTYFKTNGRRRVVHIRIDPRFLDATTDRPLWWAEQAERVKAAAPSVDFSDRCLGPVGRADWQGFAIDGGDRTDVVERHGVTGLSLGAQTSIALDSPAAVVDLAVAHFGAPPKVTAYEGDSAMGSVVTDPIPRQFENIRFTGERIDRILISTDTEEDGPLLGYLRSQPAATTDRPRRDRGRGKGPRVSPA